MTRLFSRRSLLRSGAAIGAGVGFGPISLGSASAAELTVVRSFRSTAKSWLWIVEDFASGNGDFARNGLKVESTSTGRGSNIDALLSGATDVLLGAPTPTMRVQIQGQPIKLIAGMVNKFASHVIVNKAILDKAGVTEKSPVAAKIAVLKGLKMGTTGPGASPDSLLRFLMKRGGISPDRDMQLVTVQGGGPALLAAFSRNVIDGFCLSSPTSDIAIAKFNGAFLFHMSQNPPPPLDDYLYIGVTAHEKTIADKGPMLTAYCRAIAQAMKTMQENPAVFKAWAKTFFADMESSVFEASYASDHGIYMANPLVTREQFKLNVQFLDEEMRLLTQSGVPGSFTFEKAFDMRFAEQAMKSL